MLYKVMLDDDTVGVWADSVAAYRIAELFRGLTQECYYVVVLDMGVA